MAVGINVCDTSNELGRTMGREEGGVRVSPGSSLMRESDKLIEGALRLSVKEDNVSPPSVEIDNDVDNSGKSTLIDDREGNVICGSTLEIVVGRSVLRGGRAGNSEPEGSPVIVGRIGLSVICGEVSILTETGGIDRLIKGDVGNDGDAVMKSIGLGINPEVRASASDDPRFKVGIPGKLKESLMGLNVGNDRTLLKDLSVGNAGIDASSVLGNDGTLLKELSVGNAGIDESKVVGNEGTSLKLGLGSPVKIPLGKDGSADALKMPVVNMVTVNGGGIQVTVTAPSQTA